ASSGKPMSSAKNTVSNSAPSARLTLSGKAAGAMSAPPRRRSAPTMPPSAIAPICPQDDGAPSAMMAAATASVARARSGAAARAGGGGGRASGGRLARLAEPRRGADCDSRAFEAVQPAGAGGIAERVDAVAEQHHGDGRRQRESDPGRQGSGIPATQQADGDTHLARGRPGQELAERDQVGVALIVEPAPPAHELLAEMAKMRARSAEGGQPEPKEHAQDFERASAGTPICGGGVLARRPRRVPRR